MNNSFYEHNSSILDYISSILEHYDLEIDSLEPGDRHRYYLLGIKRGLEMAAREIEFRTVINKHDNV